MFIRQKRSSRVWQPRTSQNFTLDRLQDPSQISLLKTATKKAAIMTRLSNKQFKRDFVFDNKKNDSFNEKSMDKVRRPKTSTTQKPQNFDSVKKAYQNEQRQNKKLLTQDYKNTEKSTTTKNQEIKQGLLGEYQRYEKMSKRELIEKLISLEYLANNIFIKNKNLEQKVKQLQGK